VPYTDVRVLPGDHNLVDPSSSKRSSSPVKSKAPYIGRPAEVVPPGQDERMLFSLYGMNFTKAVFGEGRAEIGMKNYLDLFGAHQDDRSIS
jgi:hypothetical protein